MRAINFIVIFSFFPFLTNAQTSLKLWYDKPSGNVWERALPLGNGKIGAMVYGNVEQETVQLNEATVWTGSPNENNRPEALASLATIRKLVFEGKQKEAELLAEKTMQTKKSNGQIFQPVGSLHLRFPHQQITNYYRELNLENAITTTRYESNGIKYQREAFVSYPANTLVMRITSSKPNSINFTTFFTSPQQEVVIQTNQQKQLLLHGSTKGHEGVAGNKLKFQSIVSIKNKGGELTQTDSSLIVAGANEVVIYINIATNFVNYHDISADEKKRCANDANSVLSESYQRIWQKHINTYQKLFKRVAIDLGTNFAQEAKPTDQRLEEFRNSYDPSFVALYFQYGRYLLISSSHPNGQPSNLQGIWNNKLNPSWDSKYTININTEMNYWPAEKTNLSETHTPLLKMVKELSEMGQETAKVMYGCRGWVAHHNTDIWRITGPVDRIFWGVWSMGGAWLCQHLWERYLYTGNEAYLNEIYPILKGASLFFVDNLVEDPRNKYLVINPGTSPENAPKAHQGSSFDAGVTMDNQIVFDLLSITIRAAETLKKDKAFADSLNTIRQRLSPMRIGQHGQIQEWMDDIDDPNDKHRHISHLYGLFPSNQISPYKTPELFWAAKNTLLQRGDISTGWSMGWKVNWWARMQDGNHAFLLIKNQLSPIGVNPSGGGTYPNLFDAHAPFQIDGNLGCTSGITEMLLQSSNNNIHLLPALPDGWQTGRISGLKTRGGFEIISLQWKDGKVSKLIIKSNLGGNLRLRLPNKIELTNGKLIENPTGENSNPFFQTEPVKTPIIGINANIKPLALKETFLFDIPTTKGKVYEFSSIL